MNGLNVRHWAVVVLLFAPLTSMADNAASTSNPEILCEHSDSDRSKLNDYRLRDSTPFQIWSFKDNWTNHTGPASERIQSGEYSHRVMADLAFTLRGWPNHIPALQALVQYDLGGGESFEFPSAYCYFTSAIEFAPDDVSVVLLEAYWQWKRGDLKGAEAIYGRALAMDPTSAEAHYHLGLLYLERRDYAKSAEQARSAYQLGYPLPGLRQKLAALGYWHE